MFTACAAACDDRKAPAEKGEEPRAMSCLLSDKNGPRQCFEYRAKPSEKKTYEGFCRELELPDESVPASFREELCPAAKGSGLCEQTTAGTVQREVRYRDMAAFEKRCVEDGGAFTAR